MSEQFKLDIALLLTCLFLLLLLAGCFLASLEAGYDERIAQRERDLQLRICVLKVMEVQND